MFKHRVAPMLGLLLAFAAQSAQAFLDPPYLTPEHPTPADTVNVNVHGGICDIFYDANTPPVITQQGNTITGIFTGIHSSDPLNCVFGTGTQTVPIGIYPAGSYTLHVIWHYNNLGIIFEEDLGTLSFVVSGPPSTPPVPIPTLGTIGIVVLLLSLVGIAAWRSGSRPSLLLLVTFVFLPLGVRAEDTQRNPAITVLVSTAPGAPTAEQLVNYYGSPRHAKSPPLNGLTVGNPQQIVYLQPDRATGDFLARLDAHPNAVRAELERYVIVLYPLETDLAAPLAALQADPYVLVAYVEEDMRFSGAELLEYGEGGNLFGPPGSSSSTSLPPGGQYGRDALNVDAAWQLAGGYALIMDIDSGLYQQHAALRQFSSPTGPYIGGNFIPSASRDISRTGFGFAPENNASTDEIRTMPVPDTACNPTFPNPRDLPPTNAGHGTHVAGLIAANGDSGQGVQGTCKHCGIAMWKVAYAACSISTVLLASNGTAQVVALMAAGDFGSQIVNMSFGIPNVPANYCTNSGFKGLCKSMAYSAFRDVVMVASSGNDRRDLDWPASDPRVIAAGGFQNDTGFPLWDLSPNTSTNCPFYPGLNTECGSNYSYTMYPNARQELMGSAQSVFSTTYPQYNWNVDTKCGDQFPGPSFGNGVGWCTGTSMSAPQIAGVIGILRSINPLVTTGTPTTTGLRQVLALTASRAQQGLGWDLKYGYGRPDAAAAARKMLGKVANAVVRNRATPLFRLYSSGNIDYADTTSPQYAASLALNMANAYVPQGTLVPGYSSFP